MVVGGGGRKKKRTRKKGKRKEEKEKEGDPKYAPIYIHIYMCIHVENERASDRASVHHMSFALFVPVLWPVGGGGGGNTANPSQDLVFTITNKTGARVRSLARITRYTFAISGSLAAGQGALKRPRHE